MNGGREEGREGGRDRERWREGRRRMGKTGRKGRNDFLSVDFQYFRSSMPFMHLDFCTPFQVVSVSS